MKIAIFLIIILIVALFIKSKKYNFEKQYKKCESPIEEKLLKELYDQGFKPYTQVSCGKYRIDIAISYKGKKVAIECDGKAYHSSPKQIEHDSIKDMVLQKNRWRVFRFTGSEIYRNSEGCIKKIKNSL